MTDTIHDLKNLHMNTDTNNRHNLGGRSSSQFSSLYKNWSKSIHNSLRYTAKCQFMLNLWMIQNLSDPKQQTTVYRHQNLRITSYLGHTHLTSPLIKIRLFVTSLSRSKNATCHFDGSSKTRVLGYTKSRATTSDRGHICRDTLENCRHWPRC